jgi:hypothetical protein
MQITGGNTLTSGGAYPGVTGTAIGAGLAGSISVSGANVNLTIVTSTNKVTSLKFTGAPVLAGTSLTISATNVGGGTIYLLTSTNGIAAPVWFPIWTNVVTGSGSFTSVVPNAVYPGLKQQYYILSTTNN